MGCSSSGPRSTTASRWCSANEPYPIHLWVSKLGRRLLHGQLRDRRHAAGRHRHWSTGGPRRCWRPVDLATGAPRRLSAQRATGAGRPRRAASAGLQLSQPPASSMLLTRKWAARSRYSHICAVCSGVRPASSTATRIWASHRSRALGCHRERAWRMPESRVTTLVGVRRRAAPVLLEEHRQPVRGRAEVVFRVERPQLRVVSHPLVEAVHDADERRR